MVQPLLVDGVGGSAAGGSGKAGVLQEPRQGLSSQGTARGAIWSEVICERCLGELTVQSL